MFNKLFPDLYVDSVFDIPYKDMAERGIKLLVFDIDNTLASYETKHPPAKIIKLMARLKKMGFVCCLLSNNGGSRIRVFNENLKLEAVHGAKKPMLVGIRKAMRLSSATEKSTAMIGDQVFTDVFCGRRAGVYTILVKPITKKDVLSVKLKRGLERRVIKLYEKSLEKSSPGSNGND